MAQKTLEKNSLLKYFEIFKDKFFKIIILNMFYFTAVVLVYFIISGINYLCVNAFGSFNNVWSLVTFLPAVALGPLTAAVIKVMRDFVREVPGFFFEDFKKAFKDNWKQSTLIALLQYFFIWAIYISYNFYYELLDGGIFYKIGLAVTFFVAIALILASYYFYMMTVTLKLTFREIIKNSFIFTMLCFLRNLLLSLILAIWIFLIGAFVVLTITSGNAFLYGIAIIIFMTLFFGVIFYTVAFFTFPPIKKHILDPYYEEHPLETAKGVEDKIISGSINYNGAEDEAKIPEFVYYNGKMVHRSALEEEQVFSDERILPEEKDKK